MDSLLEHYAGIAFGHGKKYTNTKSTVKCLKYRDLTIQLKPCIYVKRSITLTCVFREYSSRNIPNFRKCVYF